MEIDINILQVEFKNLNEKLDKVCIEIKEQQRRTENNHEAIQDKVIVTQKDIALHNQAILETQRKVNELERGLINTNENISKKLKDIWDKFDRQHDEVKEMFHKNFDKSIKVANILLAFSSLVVVIGMLILGYMELWR